MKLCKICNQTKPDTEFITCKTIRSFTCDICFRKKKNIINTRWRNNNAETVREKKRAYWAKNQNQVRQKDKEWRDNNPDRIMMRRYGISLDQYNEMLDKQNQVCAICKRINIVKGVEAKLFVDHDHNCCPGNRSCGHCVRGLLCARCNHGLGHFDDNQESLKAALDYLDPRGTGRRPFQFSAG